MSFIKGHIKNLVNFDYNWVLNELNKDNDIMGISRIGFTDDDYEVFIVTDDDFLSDVPHFHYRKKGKNEINEFHTCIRFDEAKYYHHQGNEDYLNLKQINNLIKFLNSTPKYGNFTNNWEEMLFIWNTQNEKLYIKEDLAIPNYKNYIKN